RGGRGSTRMGRGRPAVNGRPTEGSPVNRAEDRTPRGRSASVPAGFTRLSFVGRPFRAGRTRAGRSTHAPNPLPGPSEEPPGWAAGGDSGPAVVPGKPDESLLIKAVRYKDKLRMPPKEPLAPQEVEVLVRWVKDGASDPRTDAGPARKVNAKWEAEFQKRLAWWSLKPLRPVEAPEAGDGPWGRDPIDRFVKAGLDAAKLKPAPPAEAEVLLRRLSFVLTGLPPSS